MRRIEISQKINQKNKFNIETRAWLKFLAKSLVFFGATLFFSACGSSDKKTYQGYIEGENRYLASPFSGKLLHLAVRRGQQVEKGDFLFELDPNPQAWTLAEYQQEIEQAKYLLEDLKNPLRPPEIAAIEAKIEQTQADISLDRLRLDRMQKLYMKKAIDKDSVDAAAANLKKQEKIHEERIANLALAKLGGRYEQQLAQEKKIQALKAQYQAALWDLNQKKMQAPVSGIIFDSYFQEGEFVAAGKAVLSLLDINAVYVEFFLPLEAAEKIALNQKISFSSLDSSNMTEAIISYISPEAEYLPPLVYSRENQNTLVFRLKARPLHADLYKPGQPVTVYLDKKP